MKKRMILIIVIVIFFIGAIFTYRHFVLERIVDAPGMENPEAPMLGKDSIRQQAVPDRVEYGKPAENKSEEIREVSEMAELVEFSWHQSAMNYDGCFDFTITFTGQESDAPRLYCDYTDTETGERIEIGEESCGFQGFRMDGTRTDSAVCPPVPLERWKELADFLRRAELTAYSPPEPDLMDATDSKIQVTWQEDGEKFTNSYSGIYANDLLRLLQEIAGEVY